MRRRAPLGDQVMVVPGATTPTSLGSCAGDELRGWKASLGQRNVASITFDNYIGDRVEKIWKAA